jgi:hypothetical protein
MYNQLINRLLRLFLCNLGYEKRTETGLCGLHGPEEKNQKRILQSDQLTGVQFPISSTNIIKKVKAP